MLYTVNKIEKDHLFVVTTKISKILELEENLNFGEIMWLTKEVKPSDKQIVHPWANSKSFRNGVEDKKE